MANYEKLTDLYAAGAHLYNDDVTRAFYENLEAVFLKEMRGVNECAFILDRRAGDCFLIMPPAEYVDVFEYMIIKDGVDLVRLENGNLAFVGYYSGVEDVVEIITDHAVIEEMITEREEIWG